MQDLERFADIVNANLKVTLNANQIGALVSLAFNIGGSSFKSSTILARLNKGEDPNRVAREELPKLNKIGIVVFQSLVKRREAEVAFFTS